MTRRDFQMIAAALDGSRFDNDSATARDAIDTVALALADALPATNQAFHRARFLAACGVAPERAS